MRQWQGYLRKCGGSGLCNLVLPTTGLDLGCLFIDDQRHECVAE